MFLADDLMFIVYICSGDTSTTTSLGLSAGLHPGTHPVRWVVTSVSPALPTTQRGGGECISAAYINNMFQKLPSVRAVTLCNGNTPTTISLGWFAGLHPGRPSVRWVVTLVSDRSWRKQPPGHVSDRSWGKQFQGTFPTGPGGNNSQGTFPTGPGGNNPQGTFPNGPGINTCIQTRVHCV